MKKLPGESRNGFPAFDEAQKDTQVLLPPLSLSLSVLVFHARFSLATLFSRNPRKLTREYFKVFKGSAREGGAPRCRRAKETRWWREGALEKRDSSGLPLYSRYTLPLSSPLSSIFLSFVLYRNHEFRRRRH